MVPTKKTGAVTSRRAKSWEETENGRRKEEVIVKEGNDTREVGQGDTRAMDTGQQTVSGMKSGATGGRHVVLEEEATNDLKPVLV